MESILSSVKKMLGITPEDTHFDTDIIIHINSVFSQLHRLGVGPKECFVIYDDSQEWFEFLDDKNQLNDVKSYMFLKVKQIFDPPLSSSVLSSMERQIKELEWCINVTAETLKSEED